MADRKEPPQSVLKAFNVQAPLQSLSGGRGLCFLAGDIVLRPVDDTTETQWVSELLHRLNQLPHAGQQYRVAKPLQSNNPSTSITNPNFVVEGWSASSFLPGKDDPLGKWTDLLTASRAFHRDVKELVLEPPGFLSLKTDRWAEADRVTWGEKRFENVPGVNRDILRLISPHLEQLEEIKKPIANEALVCQIVHADLTGNLLFDGGADGLAPAIIDITPYWRPVEFAEAVVVADGLVNHAQGIGLIELYGTDDLSLQVLVRALYWRILTFAIQSDLDWIAAYMPQMDFQGAVALVGEVVRRGESVGVTTS